MLPVLEQNLSYNVRFATIFQHSAVFCLFNRFSHNHYIILKYHFFLSASFVSSLLQFLLDALSLSFVVLLLLFFNCTFSVSFQDFFYLLIRFYIPSILRLLKLETIPNIINSVRKKFILIHNICIDLF